jgi:LacI family transcriptional regulator
MAGVSRSTVSRVVNGQESVSPDVRARVAEVIDRTGFRPHAAARSLASSRTGVLGVVVPSGVHNLFDDPYFGRLLVGMSRAANGAGATLSLFLFESAEEEERLYPRVVAAGLVDGVVLTASRMNDPLLARLADGELPLVVVGRPDLSGVSHVDADNVGGARMAAAHLCSLGHQRVGYVGGPLSTTAGRDRLDGFLAGMASCGVDVAAGLCVESDFTERGGFDAMQRLLPARPEAVFAASDTMAIGALRALRAADLRIPDDVALVGFDGLPSSELSDPPVTTVRQPIHDTGARAVELLLELVNGTVDEPRSDVLPVELVIRESSESSTPSRIGVE